MRFRDESGVSVLEVTLAGALMLFVLSIVGMALMNAARHERTIDHLARAVAQGRGATERIAQEVRGADGLETGTGGIDVVAWFDANEDGVEDLDELVGYDIEDVGGDLRLVRLDAGGTQILADDIVTGSALSVQAATVGVLLRVVLHVDLDADASPAATVIDTEVLARNA